MKCIKKMNIRQLIKGNADDLDFITNETNIGGGTLSALQRRLDRFERWHFLVPENDGAWWP